MLFFLLLFAIPCSAAPPTLSLSYEQYQTNSFWNRSGARQNAFEHFVARSAHLYTDYWLTASDLVFASGSWTQIDEWLNGTKSGIEEVSCGWQRLIYQSPRCILHGSVTAIIPGGRYEPALRYGRWGVEPSFSYTHSSPIDVLFWTAELGYRFYLGFPSDQLRARLFVHYVPLSQLVFSIYSATEYGLFTGKKQSHQSFIRYNPNYRLLEAGASLAYFPSDYWRVTATFYQHLWGENVGAGYGFQGAVQMCF